MSWLDRFIKPFHKTKDIMPDQPSIKEPVSMDAPALPVQSTSLPINKEDEKDVTILSNSEYELKPEDEFSEMVPESEEDEKIRHRLRPHEARHVCQLIAMFRSDREITAYTEEHYNISLSPYAIHYYKKSPTWRAVIDKYRKRYFSRIEEIPLANKIKRIEKLQAQYERLEQIEAQKQKAKDKVYVMRDQRQLLSQIQDEVEGKGSKIMINDSSISYKFANMSQEKFEEYRLSLLERISQLQKKKLTEVKEIPNG